MTGFEPATPRPPAVYANRTAPHPEKVVVYLSKIIIFYNNLRVRPSRYQRDTLTGLRHIPKIFTKNGLQNKPFISVKLVAKTGFEPVTSGL
jgi:hypothetical protein